MKFSSEIIAFIHEISIAEKEAEQLLPGSSKSMVDEFLGKRNDNEIKEYVKILVESKNPKKEEFLKKLKQKGRLDLSIEAIVLKKFREYFDDDVIQNCKNTLNFLEYTVT